MVGKGLHEGRAGGAFGKPGVVLHVLRRGSLSAWLGLFDEQGPELAAGAVHGGRQAAGAAANNDNIPNI